MMPFFRRRKEQELAEELRFHLEEEAAARREAGLPAEDARLRLRRTSEIWAW